MKKNRLKQIALSLTGLLIFNLATFAQVGPHLEDVFTTSKTLLGWTAPTANSVMTQNSTTGIITIAPGTNGSGGAYRGDFKKTADATNYVRLNSTTYPIVAIKFNKPSNARVTFDTNLGSFKNTYNKYTEISTTDGRNVYYYDLSESGATFGTTAISGITQPMDLSVFQFKIADMPFADGQKNYDIEWVQTFASLSDLMTSISSVLPVSLTSYTASLQTNGNAQLNWKVASENNNSYFLVERKSGDGNFIEIGHIPSKGNGASSYYFDDQTAPAGKNYYRLSQVDKDGSKMELGVKAVDVTFNQSKSLNVFPNPITGNNFSFTYGLTNDDVSVKISDTSGKILFSSQVKSSATGTYQVNLTSKLQQGIYILHVNGTATQKILIK